MDAEFMNSHKPEPMFFQNAVTATAVLVLMILSSSQVAAAVGSWSELWFWKTDLEKAAYLDGYCQALSETLPTYPKKDFGNLQCADKTGKRALVFQFCGKVADDDAKPAIQYLDNFYRDKKHSDVPTWAAAAAHDDQSCNEQTVKGRLPSIQARELCFRQLMNMSGARFSQPVIEKQREECYKLNSLP